MDDLSIDRTDGTIRLGGELTQANISKLFQEFETIDGQAVDVDVAGLRFIDSSGLGALLRVRQEHAGIRYVNSTPNLRYRAKITGLVDALGITPE